MARVRWLILTAAVSGWWIQLILGTSCQGGMFGDTCSYLCHCTPPCNQTTGVCNGACDRGWFGGNGQTCQRENVAFNKTASSPPTDHGRLKGWTADKVVDGNRDQDVFSNSCFHSHSTAPNPTWTVDLGQPYRIHDVRIYNRPGHPRSIRTAVLKLSNSSSFTPGVTCFTFPNDTTQTYTSVYDVTCDGTGRYFTITHSTRLNLCEVEIYVCSNGTYGPKCSNICTDRNCAGDSRCDHVRGTCVSGCEAGWMGDDCIEVCSIGSYGQKCNNSCIDRKCVGDSPCDHIRGTCVSGCAPGWMGEACREVCDIERYGANCDKNCASRQCVGNSSCNSTGDCDNGCETRWIGADCTVCGIGRYGANCDKTYSSRHCVGNSSCYSTGHCDCGCVTGWTGADCTEDVRSVQAAGYNVSQLAVAVAVAFVAGAVLGVIVSVVVWRRRNRRLHKTSESHPTNVSTAQTERSQASDYVGPEARPYDSLNAVSYDAKMKGETYCTIKSGKTNLGTDATVLTSCDVSDSIVAGTYETLDNTSRGTDGEYSEIGKVK